MSSTSEALFKKALLPYALGFATMMYLVPEKSFQRMSFQFYFMLNQSLYGESVFKIAPLPADSEGEERN